MSDQTVKPAWLERAPQTPLHEKLHGKQYDHWLICSGNRRKPIGHPGCICLKALGKP